MSAPGATAEDPVHRTSMTFVSSETGMLEVTTTMAAGSHLPEHFHPSLDERWWVEEGEVELKLDGRWRTVTSAEGVIEVPRNVRHELRNRSGRTARLGTEVRPPGRLQEFLVESAAAAQAGMIAAGGRPRTLRGVAWAAEFALRFRDETVMCSPPPAVQRWLLPIAARLTRRWR